MIRLLGILLLSALLLNGCKKEGDESAPIIDFINPNSGITVQLPDTLEVAAYVTDDHVVRNIRLSLINSDAIAVGPSFTNTYSESQVNFSVAFVIDDISLLSGPYNLQLTASDGVNESKAFIPITLLEVPRSFEGFIYCSEADSQTMLTHSPTIGPSESITHQGTNCRLSVNQVQNQLFLSSDESIVSSFNYLNGFQSQWSISMTDEVSIHDLIFDEGRNELFVSVFGEGVYSYSTNGSDLGFIPLEPDEELLDIAFSQDELWLSFRQENGLFILVTVFRDSGVRIDERVLSFQGDVLKFRNENELAMGIPEGDIRLLNIVTDNIIPIDVPDNGPVLQIREYLNELYILKENAIYRMTSNLQIQILYTGTGLQELQIDEVNGRVYLIESDVLKVFNLFPWMELGAEALLPNSNELLLLYNR